MFLRISDTRIHSFQDKILHRYDIHERDLPWRKTIDPYLIWISESMLCQTQVTRVISYYERWIKTFSTIQDLAQASKAHILTLWSGLGYNSRALRLYETAQIIIDRFDGVFPSNYKDLISLPGVGEYIANAVLAFAYNRDVIVIDTNIRRIMIHEFALGDDKLMEQLWASQRFEKQRLIDIVHQTLLVGNARRWYNALMDYGALSLTASLSGITPRTKQTRFQGSTRQVRSTILKMLLSVYNHIMPIDQIVLLFPERDDVHQIIMKMVGEGIIVIKGTTILLTK
ncbi:MAG TPA: hypothetical protein PLW93_02920 [Candidatus Absconditabacterales bacterium]|nr:hypothetical protein [Candidatus Absconditabacterales bacterium]